MTATVIIPFHRNLRQLAQSLPAARRAMPAAEIIVAADGAVEDCRDLAAQTSSRVVSIQGPLGPAVARNRAAAEATGEILIFVDADVVPAPDALVGLADALAKDPGIAAVFGAYDLEPPEPNFMSQYKNLSHACVHEMGSTEAGTFWAGLGAVRRNAFREVGGFDERFSRPSVEDIELGYRLRRAGHRIRLDVRFRGKHLKKWTLANSIITDIRARGIPWTQLIYRYGALTNDLNTRHELRWSVVLAYVLLFAGLAMPIWPSAAVGAIAALITLLVLNRSYYAWFVRRRGWLFAARVVPAHWIYHLCNGVSFVFGTVIHYGARFGMKLPGTLPDTSWPTPSPPVL